MAVADRVLGNILGPRKDKRSKGMAQSDLVFHVAKRQEWGYKSPSHLRGGKQVVMEKFKGQKLPAGIEAEPGEVWKTRWYDKDKELTSAEAAEQEAQLRQHAQGKHGDSFFITGVHDPSVVKVGSKKSKYKTL